MLSSHVSLAPVRRGRVVRAWAAPGWVRWFSAAASMASLACQPARSPNQPELASPSPTTAAPGDAPPHPLPSTAPHGGPNDARGGRLYDNWRLEKGMAESFVPDPVNSAAIDGKGGPNRDGTLNDGAGRPLPNNGHDYRLKNLFGWDLRGAEGISGSAFQRKPYVLEHNLLTDTRSAEELREWLARGAPDVPAYGQVLSDEDLDDLVAFLVKTRDGELARPSSIIALDEKAPGHYVLAPGGDPARGRNRYAVSCADCHGDDGRYMTIDDTESLGTMSRSNAYEVWFKMLNGQPGTDMRRQILDHGGPDQERAILDVLAALCDRTAFPAMAGAKDVADADPRCSSYLR
jgi:mono/diheme cytochrome c family protein